MTSSVLLLSFQKRSLIFFFGFWFSNSLITKLPHYYSPDKLLYLAALVPVLAKLAKLAMWRSSPFALKQELLYEGCFAAWLSGSLTLAHPRTGPAWRCSRSAVQPSAALSVSVRAAGWWNRHTISLALSNHCSTNWTGLWGCDRGEVPQRPRQYQPAQWHLHHAWGWLEDGCRCIAHHGLVTAKAFRYMASVTATISV